MKPIDNCGRRFRVCLYEVRTCCRQRGKPDKSCTGPPQYESGAGDIMRYSKRRRLPAVTSPTPTRTNTEVNCNLKLLDTPQ
ncbi:hypothetical protein BaRGS_00035651 [Batillaria attramentaria]|uniref:Uncharacterized protein n=1 Tax=Batillaria attramentaria TaxID=370345 RepID=A0ABD0JEA5_9CAEN